MTSLVSFLACYVILARNPTLRRREFITFVSSAATAWPLAVRGQQPLLPLIGVLSSGPAKLREDQSDGLLRGLKEAGFAEGENLTILYRGADDHYDRLPALAAELVSRSVALIATAGGPVAALAAKAATSVIPIVFAAVSDPVKSGLVASLNRPGGNVTGNAGLTIELDAKRLELLCELTPNERIIGALVNAKRPRNYEPKSPSRRAGDRSDEKLVIVRGALKRMPTSDTVSTHPAGVSKERERLRSPLTLTPD